MISDKKNELWSRIANSRAGRRRNSKNWEDIGSLPDVLLGGLRRNGDQRRNAVASTAALYIQSLAWQG
jgi:hypothetical protein